MTLLLAFRRSCSLARSTQYRRAIIDKNIQYSKTFHKNFTIMSSDNNKLDLIIFGATGFTGKWTVYEACSVLKGISWGVAGRNRNKLQDVLKEMGAKANKDLTTTPTFVADVANEQSLVEMASACRVLVNCCGPYRFYGEPVIRACIEAGTHHVDVSGESQFMETMQLKYHKQAAEKGVYMISACGFDSIPTEMGITYLENNFHGVLNSVETFLKSWSQSKERPRGAAIHYGTYESAIHALANMHELASIRAQLYKEKLPSFQPKLKMRAFASTAEDVVKGIVIPFPSPDIAVVARTQRFLYEEQQKRPVQMMAYINLKSTVIAYLLLLFGKFFLFMNKYSWGRKILLNHPKLCTLGLVSHEGPAEEAMQNSRFAMILKGEGWPDAERLAAATDQYKNPPTESLTVQVTGCNPGYGATCVALLCTATTILKESDKMPGKGGVLPPGYAFAKTSLIEELQKHEHGLKFELLQRKYNVQKTSKL